MSMIWIGIDVAKAWLDIMVLGLGEKQSLRVDNTPAGWKQLVKWLGKIGAREGRVCMEATGAYYEGVAEALQAAGFCVYVVNPAWVKKHAQSYGRHTKTDRLDAWLLADYLRSHDDLSPWSPPSPEVKVLRDMTRRLAALSQMHQQEINRLKSGAFCPTIQAVTADHIADLKQRIAQLQALLVQHIKAHRSLQRLCRLLTSIPGIGVKTAACLIAEIQDISRFASAKQLASYAGLCPTLSESGLARGKSHLSPAANRRLRAAFYFPAMVVKRCSPLFSSLADRHIAAGHCKMSAQGVLMHKLIRIVFGVWSSGQPFDLARLTP
jgi:transposase